MFSMTVLLIILGILGEAKMAADVGVIQAATVVVFLAFGTNARNIILSKSESITLFQLFKFRIIIVFPLALVAYFLSKGFIELANEITFFLILRRCVEWIVELQISDRELHDDKKYGYIYSGIQVIAFIGLLASIKMEGENHYLIFLILWAISPGCQLIAFTKSMFHTKSDKKISWSVFMPHLGATWIIAISTYVFRILIILLVGKVLGGLLFSAYAIGGMINAVYAYALGPTIVARTNGNSSIQEWNFTKLVLLLLVMSGSLIALFSTYFIEFKLPETQFYCLAIGFSLIGSGIMLLSQKKRIQMLQIDKESVFVPDVLANILIISSVPILYYLLGYQVLIILFLLNSIINYSIYTIPSIYINSHENLKAKSIIQLITLSKIQICVLLFLFIPVFFQIDGQVIFNNVVMIYNYSGEITKLPLPLSAIACFIGLFFLIRYKKCHLSTIFLFSYFVMMIIAIFISSSNNTEGELEKFIFLIQSILPVFALVVGESYVDPMQSKYSFEAIFLYVIAIIIPLEVIATLEQSTGILTPYLYKFSLYQHLQYMPVIFIGAYLLSLNSLCDNYKARILLFILAPFIGIYTVFSFSNLAMILLLLGMVFSLFTLMKNGQGRFSGTVFLTILIFVILAINFDKINYYDYESKSKNFIAQKNAYFESKKTFIPLIFRPNVIPEIDRNLYDIAFKEYRNENFEKAFEKFSALATQKKSGTDAAMYYLADLYYAGKGVPQDYQKAIFWYTKAAEIGFPYAMIQLAKSYEDGKGIKQDYQKAIFWYTEAAKMGLSTAMNRLSIIYSEGKIALKNERKSLLWKNNANEQAVIDLMYHEQNSASINKNSQYYINSLYKDEALLSIDKSAFINWRLNIWNIYWESIVKSPLTFLFGQEVAEHKKTLSSAHNYYLDVMYHFGFISLLPILALMLYTFILIYRSKSNLISSPALLALTFLVVFYLLIDNSLKVGLRQPYSGIITFFLWGVLLKKLQKLNFGK